MDPGSTPGPGPPAACHSPSLTLFPVTLFSYPVNKARKGQKKKRDVSDHSGVYMKINLDIPHKNTIWRLNTSLLNDNQFEDFNKKEIGD